MKKLVERSQHRKSNKGNLKILLTEYFRRRSKPQSLLKRIADLSAKPPAARYLTADACASMIKEQTGLQWKGRLTPNRHIPRTADQVRDSSPWEQGEVRAL